MPSAISQLAYKHILNTRSICQMYPKCLFRIHIDVCIYGIFVYIYIPARMCASFFKTTYLYLFAYIHKYLLFIAQTSFLLQPRI